MEIPTNSKTGRQTTEASGNGWRKAPKSREKLLAAAIELFGTHGFGRTSVDDVLKAAGVTKSNFYYHFAGKDALGTEALMRMQEIMKQTVWPETLQNADLSPLERISQFVQSVTDTLVANQCNGGCPFANLAIELSDDWPHFREQLADFFRAMVAEIANCLREAQAAGQIRPELDPEETAHLLFAQFEGSVLLAKTYKNVAPIRQSFSAAIKLIQA